VEERGGEVLQSEGTRKSAQVLLDIQGVLVQKPRAAYAAAKTANTRAWRKLGRKEGKKLSSGRTRERELRRDHLEDASVLSFQRREGESGLGP